MDQLRQVFGWLRRHHFWVLTVVAAVVALGCWFQGASALHGEFTDHKQTIETEFTKLSNLHNQLFHANEDINKQQEIENAEQRKGVNALWQQLYERQRADVLQWPRNLSDGFRRHVERLKFGEDIPNNLRAHYNNYVGDHFPELPKIVGALELVENVRGASRGRGDVSLRAMIGRMDGRPRGGDLLAVEEDFIVLWHDQERIRGELYMPTTPSAKRIWVTQEDLWVYEALLGIIARTNQAAGSDRYSNAKIRDIYSLEVGRRAAQASRSVGRIAMVAPIGGPGMMRGGMDGGGMDGEGGYGDDGGYGGYGGGYGEGGYGEGGYGEGGYGEGGYGEGGYGEGGYGEGGYGGRGYGDGDDGEGGYGGSYGSTYGGRDGEMGGQFAGDAALFFSRYLDNDGKPILSTGEGGPDEFGREFKRLPIRMQLEMDQRWLPHLIAECANAPLQVEVTEVRINPAGGIESSGRGSYGRRGGDRSNRLVGGQDRGPMFPEQEPNIKPVIIQGTIFIFNPPSVDTTGQQVVVAQ